MQITGIRFIVPRWRGGWYNQYPSPIGRNWALGIDFHSWDYTSERASIKLELIWGYIFVYFWHRDYPVRDAKVMP